MDFTGELLAAPFMRGAHGLSKHAIFPCLMHLCVCVYVHHHCKLRAVRCRTSLMLQWYSCKVSGMLHSYLCVQCTSCSKHTCRRIQRQILVSVKVGREGERRMGRVRYSPVIAACSCKAMTLAVSAAGAQMVLTLKVISAAVCYADGLRPEKVGFITDAGDHPDRSQICIGYGDLSPFAREQSSCCCWWCSQLVLSSKNRTQSHCSAFS